MEERSVYRSKRSCLERSSAIASARNHHLSQDFHGSHKRLSTFSSEHTHTLSPTAFFNAKVDLMALHNKKKPRFVANESCSSSSMTRSYFPFTINNKSSNSNSNSSGSSSKNDKFFVELPSVQMAESHDSNSNAFCTNFLLSDDEYSFNGSSTSDGSLLDRSKHDGDPLFMDVFLDQEDQNLTSNNNIVEQFLVYTSTTASSPIRVNVASSEKHTRIAGDMNDDPLSLLCGQSLTFLSNHLVPGLKSDDSSSDTREASTLSAQFPVAGKPTLFLRNL